MMNVSMYTYYDKKAGFYNIPFYAQNDDIAVRNATIFANQKDNAILAEDLELYCVGSFDSESGVIVAFNKPRFVKNLIEVVRHE